MIVTYINPTMHNKLFLTLRFIKGVWGRTIWHQVEYAGGKSFPLFTSVLTFLATIHICVDIFRHCSKVCFSGLAMEKAEWILMVIKWGHISLGSIAFSSHWSLCGHKYCLLFSATKQIKMLLLCGGMMHAMLFEKNKMLYFLQRYAWFLLRRIKERSK